MEGVRNRARRARGPEIVEEPVGGGLARLVPDPQRAESWELLIDGAPQSHVDMADPTRLVFEYQRRLGHMADLAAPPGQPLAVLHLGGGALSIARYVAVTRPRSTQQVAEPDTRLTDLIRRELPLPHGARVRVRAGDARDVLGRIRDGWADLVITDVFDEARTPAHVTSGEFLDEVRRVLRPGGTYAANVTDGPPFRHLRGQVATVRSRFTDVVLTAETPVLNGRRYGNGVLWAADRPLPLVELGHRCAADPAPARLLVGRDLADFAAGTPPVTDATALPSPPPPLGTFEV
ncbi:spermine synthase [Streptomyces radicis]|uniref:Spermine synthase n=1 Tax=Streptomyces radicis TaxID=1750517 RepID=A0A3A9WMX9_9ACTN|nr:fused MFS/spermidine synthase [Streptomyces radicis]RKN09096.1 spermine synthase [Streptomyces radicis]RKN22913.1 spermine synthase [Streptomyces radicis]